MVQFATDDFQKASDDFMAWLSSQDGVEISPKIGLHDFSASGSGRGLIASTPIAADEVLFSIPRRLALSWKTSSLQSALATEITDDWSEWDRLTLALLYENSRGLNSPWKCYFDVLPHTFNTPMFWSTEELRELEGSTLVSKIGREEADQSFHQLIEPIVSQHPASFDCRVCTLADFHRMGSIIMAYSFDAPDFSIDDVPEDNKSVASLSSDEDNEKLEKIMCPLADMLNADTVLNNARLIYERDALVMKSVKEIAKDEQIYNTYGDLPNADLLRRYGYIQRQNRHDVLEIQADLVTSIFEMTEEETLRRIDWLLDNEILDDSFEVPISGKLPPELLATVAMMDITADDFDEVMQSDDIPKVVKTSRLQGQVIQILRLRSEQYPESLDADLDTLKAAELGHISLPMNKLNAMYLRSSEKAILQTVQRKVQEWHTVDDHAVDYEQEPTLTKRPRPTENGSESFKKTRFK